MYECWFLCPSVGLFVTVPVSIPTYLPVCKYLCVLSVLFVPVSPYLCIFLPLSLGLTVLVPVFESLFPCLRETDVETQKHQKSMTGTVFLRFSFFPVNPCLCITHYISVTMY